MFHAPTVSTVIVNSGVQSLIPRILGVWWRRLEAKLAVFFLLPHACYASLVFSELTVKSKSLICFNVAVIKEKGLVSRLVWYLITEHTHIHNRHKELYIQTRRMFIQRDSRERVVPMTSFEGLLTHWRQLQCVGQTHWGCWGGYIYLTCHFFLLMASFLLKTMYLAYIIILTWKNCTSILNSDIF